MSLIFKKMNFLIIYETFLKLDQVVNMNVKKGTRPFKG